MIATARSAVQAYVDAIERRDFDAVERVFAPRTSFRAVMPRVVHEASTAYDARAIVESWFAGIEDFEVVHRYATRIGELTMHIGFRVNAHRDGMPMVLEQHVYVTNNEDGIATMDVLCSGFAAGHE